MKDRFGPLPTPDYDPWACRIMFRRWISGCSKTRLMMHKYPFLFGLQLEDLGRMMTDQERAG